MTPGRGCRPIFVALWVQHEPFDQTNLKDGVDAILGGGGGSFWEGTTRWSHRGPGDLPHGPGDLLQWPLDPCFIVVSSGTF
jgi:hypothetical protein